MYDVAFHAPLALLQRTHKTAGLAPPSLRLNPDA